MSKQALREETDRLIREAMEKNAVTVTKGKTRIEASCGKCNARNRVVLAPGETRGTFTCKECGHKQKSF
jgi:predicted RNA-binding Zn ribbon-like protein